MLEKIKNSLITFLGENTTQLVLSVIAIVVGVLVWQVIARVFRRYIAKLSAQKKPTTAFHVAYNAVKYIIIIITAIVVLQFNGVNVTAMVAGLGVLSGIVGIALQNEIKDMVMGLHLATDNFFQVGDVVEYKGITGKVVGYSLKFVRLQTIADGSIMTICNSNITEITRCSDVMHINVPLSYEDKPQKIEEVLRSICADIETDENVTSAAFRGTQNFNNSSIDYRITIHCPPENMPDVRRMANRLIQDGLDAAGIVIPFNQLDLHMKQ